VPFIGAEAATVMGFATLAQIIVMAGELSNTVFAVQQIANDPNGDPILDLVDELQSLFNSGGCI
jgi:hypothetical protein